MRKSAVFWVVTAYAVLLFSLFVFQVSSLSIYSNSTLQSSQSDVKYPSYLGFDDAQYHPENSIYGKIVAFFASDKAESYSNSTNTTSELNSSVVWTGIKAFFSIS